LSLFSDQINHHSGALDINGFKDIIFSANFTDNLTKYVVFARHDKYTVLFFYHIR